MKIRRIKDGQFIKEFEERPGYRHVVTSTDISQALDFSEKDCQKICDCDFFENPCSSFKPGTINRKPEFKRWSV